MQQAAVKHPQLHACRKQRLVIGAAGIAHQARIDALRQNQHHFHAALGGQNQRVQQRLVRHEIGRADDHPLLRHIERVAQHVVHQRHVAARLRRDDLQQRTAGRLRRHLRHLVHIAGELLQRRREIVFVFHRPVAVKHRRQLLRHRALAAQHRIDPLADARFLFEQARIDQVVAAGVGDAVIDDEDFAVVAQIAAHPQRFQQADRQRFCHLHPCRAQALRPRRTPKTAAAERVCEQLAAHTAPGRPHQRFQHRLYPPGALDDIKLQQAAMLRRLNIGDERLQNRVCVGQKARRIAAGGDIAGIRLHQMGNLAETHLAQRHRLRRQEAVGKSIVKGEQLRLPLRPRPPQFRLANQKIDDDAQNWESEQHRQPGERGATGTARIDDAQRDGKRQAEVKEDEQTVPVHRGLRGRKGEGSIAGRRL